MEFEWGQVKAETNLRKHRVSFEDATRVFLDTNRIETFDGRDVYGEDRWKTVGLAEHRRVGSCLHRPWCGR